MRITFNTMSDALINQLQSLGSQQSVLQNEITTGQSVTNPSDNPSAMGSALNIEAQKQQLIQYSSNSNTATAISQAVYNSVNALNSLSTSASTLATQSTGITTPEAYQTNATQVNELIKQGLQTLNAQYNGSYIFGGTNSTTAPFTATYDANGNITGVTYNGTTDTAEIPIADGISISPTTNGATNQQLGDFLNNLVTLRDALTNQDSSAVQTAQPALETSEDNIVQTVGEVGATQTQIEAQATQNQSTFTALMNQESNETSADIATTTVKLSQAQTAYQAALESSAKMLSMSLIDYLPASTS